MVTPWGTATSAEAGSEAPGPLTLVQGIGASPGRAGRAGLRGGGAVRLRVCALQPAERWRVRARKGRAGGGAEVESGPSPLACVLPELGHPRVELLLVPHLEDDVCAVLHLAGGGSGWVLARVGVSPVWKALTHLQHKGVEVVGHLEAGAPPDLLEAGARCLQLGL